jgi:hypothetical protein
MSIREQLAIIAEKRACVLRQQADLNESILAVLTSGSGSDSSIAALTARQQACASALDHLDRIEQSLKNQLIAES